MKVHPSIDRDVQHQEQSAGTRLAATDVELTYGSMHHTDKLTRHQINIHVHTIRVRLDQTVIAAIFPGMSVQLSDK